MKQPKLKVKTVAGQDCGVKNVMSASWGRNGDLHKLLVDFLEDSFYPYSVFYEDNGVFIHVNGTLIGELLE